MTNDIKIGKVVYLIYGDCIIKEHIGYIGKDSFIIEEYYGKCEDSLEWLYEDYDKKWSFRLSKAKELLIKQIEETYGGKYKVVKQDYDYWETEEIDN